VRDKKQTREESCCILIRSHDNNVKVNQTFFYCENETFRRNVEKRFLHRERIIAGK